MGGLWRQIQPYVLLGAQSGGDPSQTTPFLVIKGVLIASWFGETPFPGSSSLRCSKDKLGRVGQKAPKPPPVTVGCMPSDRRREPHPVFLHGSLSCGVETALPSMAALIPPRCLH